MQRASRRVSQPSASFHTDLLCTGAIRKAQQEHKRAKAVDESLQGLHDENMRMRSQLHELEMRETRAQKEHER